MRFYSIVLIVCFLHGAMAHAQTELTTANSVKRDVFIHPADAYTGYCLKKGAWIYTQPFDLKTGLFQIGLNDKNTLLLPTHHWFEKNMSIGYRRAVLQKPFPSPALALEVHYQYLLAPGNQVDFNPDIEVWRLGHNLNLRLNSSFALKENLYLHLSAGTTYSEILNVNIPDNDYTNDITMGNNLSPDILITIDWRAKDWLALFLSPSYGSTFFYADNTPRKKQLLIGSRLAPFTKSNNRFLNRLRLEIVYYTLSFFNSGISYSTISGNLYWTGYRLGS